MRGSNSFRPDQYRPAAAASGVSAVDSGSPEVAAVNKMRELVKSGELKNYYEAAIDLSHPELKDEALKLFEALPQLDTRTKPADFVRLGFWPSLPVGLDAVHTSPRFLPGRQVLVETTVNDDLWDTQNFLAYKEGGRTARTYRATLAGEAGDDFLVKVDGKDEPIRVPKAKVYALNQPHQYDGEVIRDYGVAKTIDYRSPLMKAKLAETALKMAPMVEKLDFTKPPPKNKRPSNVLLGGADETATELQRRCARVAHDVINMKYPKPELYKEPGRYSGEDAGRLAVCGIGMCVEQASVMLGMLLPFRDALGIDVQYLHGPVYRLAKKGENPFVGGEGHGWLQLTYRPSMELRICDRTWQQPDHPADRAYSRFGDRYPSSHFGKPQKVTDTDVNMSGEQTLAVGEREFGQQGVDGRENHQSLHQ